MARVSGTLRGMVRNRAGGAAHASAPGCDLIAAPTLVQVHDMNEAAQGAPPTPPELPTDTPPSAAAQLLPCGLSPPVVNLRVGQTLELRNAGPDTRSVRLSAGDGKPVPLAMGGTLSFRPRQPGVYPVLCQGATDPCGYVAAADRPQAALVDEAGRFEIPRVPTGAHTVVAFGPAALGRNIVQIGAGQLSHVTVDLDPSPASLALASTATGLRDCQITRAEGSPIARACAAGGVKRAKLAMKSLVRRGKDRGLKYECDSCHKNEEDWTLTEDARTNFATLLTATGT
jgi:hypothetical protein